MQLGEARAGKERSSRSRSTPPSSSSDIGPSFSRPISSGCRARSRPSGGGSSCSVRLAISKRTGASSIRRKANSSTSAVGTSNHWTSSIATTRGSRAATSRSSASTARDSASRVAGSPAGARWSARSSAARCVSARVTALLSRTGSSKSPSAANGSAASPSAGLARSTVELFLASSTPCSQSVVLPMPASPSMTRARRGDAASSSSCVTDASSAVRPTIAAVHPRIVRGFAATRRPRC